MPVQDATWQEIWDRKGARPVAEYDLETLLDLDGYDVGAGSLGADDFQAVVDLVVDRLALKPGMRVLEVGCGAGALLWGLRERGLELSGIDFSAPLIDHARAAIPEAEFRVAEAVDVEGQADAIVCCGVFHYFPDFEYAQRVLDGFMRAAPVALVMDVPDLATQDASEAARREAGSKPGDHLYYPRSFFGEGATAMQSEVPGYRNAPFRFHALVSR